MSAQKGFTLIRTLLRRNLVNVHGFTLIELLVVISIISILAVIGFVSFQNIQQKAKDAKMRSDLNAIKKAYEANYSPSANNGQGGYIQLQGSQFVGGQKPKKPDNTDYTYDYGPDNASNPQYDGYRVSAQTSDGKTVSAVSNQGTASTTQLNSCDPTNSLSNGLVGYWKMDESQGAVTAVDTINGNNGLWIGTGTPHYVIGKLNNAGNFNGSNDGVTVNANAVLLQNGNYSLSIWFNPANNTPSFIILNNAQYGIKWNGSTNMVQYYDNVYLNSTKTSWTLGQWYHLVMVKSGGTVSFYVNGSLDSSGNGATHGPNSNISIGYGVGYFNGQIDDVRIYNRALPPTEITTLWNNGNGCSP